MDNFYIVPFSLKCVKLTALYIDINTRTPSLHTHTHTHTHTEACTHVHELVSYQNTVITFGEK